MKVLFVHERFGAFAGAEVNVQLTAAELKRRGHEVGIVHGAATGREENAWNGTFAHRFPFRDDPAESMRAAASEFDPDVIYVHKLEDLQALKTLVNSSRSLVRMVHDHDLYCMRSYKYHPLTRRICRRPASPYCVFPCGASLKRNRGGGLPLQWVSYSAKRAELRLNRKFHRMIVATHYMKQELLRNRFAADRIEIHAPVPRLATDAPQASFSDRNLILYSGQLIRGKGVDVLVESLARVQTTFACLIFGDGNHRAYCEALSRKMGLQERVHFKGFVSQPELQHEYCDASVAVVSSVWPEPFGAVGLEAMLHGLPVVAFDAGGINGWLLEGHNGFLVPWMDRDAFAARLEQLLRDKPLARLMGERGRRLAREKFDFNRYIDGLEDMFARVIFEAKAVAHSQSPAGRAEVKT